MTTWTAQECADHWSVSEQTWRGYVSRHQAPRPVGYDPETGLRVWNQTEVMSRKPGAKWKTEEAK